MASFYTPPTYTDIPNVNYPALQTITEYVSGLTSEEQAAYNNEAVSVGARNKIDTNTDGARHQVYQTARLRAEYLRQGVLLNASDTIVASLTLSDAAKLQQLADAALALANKTQEAATLALEKQALQQTLSGEELAHIADNAAAQAASSAAANALAASQSETALTQAQRDQAMADLAAFNAQAKAINSGHLGDDASFQ